LAGGGVIGWILVSGAYGRPLKIFEVLLYIFNYFSKEFGGTGENRAYCGC
jgi:hypothetical protein